jgi:hypothetical protein
MWLEVFKTGTHTSGNGTEKSYTESDIDKIVEKYNDQKDHEAPLVLGHPEVDDPAYGWVKSLRRVGDKMQAFVEQVNDGLKESVRAGAYKKVSIALYADGLLRHIGLLGATPPAVKGLAPFTFKDGDMVFDEYIWATDEYRVPIVGRLLRGMRDFFIEKFSLAEADKILPSEDIDRLSESVQSNLITVPTVPENMKSMYVEDKTKQEENIMPWQKKFEDLEKQFTELNAKSATLITELAAANQQIATFAEKEKENQERAHVVVLETERVQFADLCESMVKEGKVLAGEKDGMIAEFADMQRIAEHLTFAEDEKTLLGRYKKRLEARPVLIKAGTQFANGKDATRKDLVDLPVEFASMAGEVIEESLDQHKKIQEYADTHKVSYEDAAAKVMGM